MKTNLLKAVLISNLLLFSFLITIDTKAQNIGINGSGANAHPSALLDVDAVSTPSLGILIPRIALQAINLAAPVVSPATSLLVYNTATASSGANAVSAGYYYWDGVRWVRFAYNPSGISTVAWNILGNAGTNSATNFIGTTDNQDLVFKRNNIQAGLLDDASDLTAFGVGALATPSLGANNTAIGRNAMRVNTTGYNGVAVGHGALFTNTTGSYNTALGGRALYSNTTGLRNVAVGYDVLYNTTGDNNVAVGYASGATNNTGSNNVFIGFNSNPSANSFTNAIAIGANAIVGQSNALVLGGSGSFSVNVGIGITTPLNRLHVADNSTTFSGRVTNSNATGTGFIGIGQNVGGSFLPAGSGGSFSGGASGLVADADNATGTGIRAIGNNVSAYPALVGGSGGAFAGTAIGVYGIANNAANSTAGGYFDNGNGSFAYVGFTTAGGVAQKINGPGVVSTIVKNTKNESVNLYCPEAPEVLFQDFGKGILVNGVAHITLDETFIKNVTINDKHPLRVIIQLEGDCNGVYVTNKTTTSFDVKELQNGNSNVTFTYFITANRADAYNEDGTLFSKFADVRYGEAPSKAKTNNDDAEQVNR